jgi:NAD(P)-dependent dehydrogenase (short-subunit alcohol dehydrogenase family)
MKRLQGKVAIVTGAAGGIGAATARRFVEEGASVVLADLSEEALKAVAKSLDDAKVAICPTDVSRKEDVERCVKVAVERFGGVDIMMANAGVEGLVAPVTEYPLSEFDRVLAINVRGVFLAIQAAAPMMEKRGGGVILATSSVAGLVGAGGLSAYVTSKHAVMGLVKSAAIELAPLGIRVVAINPGPINNAMMRHIEEKAAPGAAKDVQRGFEAKVPMGRYGENDEVVAMAVFLASNEASYCTGAAYLVDGGFVAQ